MVPAASTTVDSIHAALDTADGSAGTSLNLPEAMPNVEAEDIGYMRTRQPGRVGGVMRSGRTDKTGTARILVGDP